MSVFFLQEGKHSGVNLKAASKEKRIVMTLAKTK